MNIKKHIILILMFLAGTGSMFAQVLTGTITEQTSFGVEPVIGANVNVINSSNRYLKGTVTDENGVYRIQVPENEGAVSITFSFVGMKTQKIRYTGQKTLDVRLESAQQLNEVVVTARQIDRNDMGVSQKEQVTATQKIQMDALVASMPVTTVEEALQGRLGGVDIVMGGGDPGARSSIRIRGTSTLSSSAEPLIVIDGIPYNTDIDEDFDFSTANNENLGALLNIAPTDIESVEVLKDAAATAIWGTKGSNGVLVINTKRGQSGKTSFSFSSKFTAKQEPRTIPMLNGDQYVALMQEALWNSYNYVGAETVNNKYLTGLYGTKSIGYDPNWIYFDEYNQNTDWLGEIRQTALSWDNNFSMSGGGDKAVYRFSLGYLNEGGTTIGTGLKRLNTTLTIHYNFSNKLTFGADFGYSQSDVTNDYARNLRAEAFRKMPNKSPYYIDNVTGERTPYYFSLNETVINRRPSELGIDDQFDGKKNKNYNPVAMANESYNNSTQRDAKITFRMNYSILPSLRYSGWASINMRTNKNRKFLPQEATGVVLTDPYSNRSTDGYSDQMALQFENKLSFNKRWEDTHNLIATAVMRTSQTVKSSYSSQTAGNVSSSLSDPIIGNKVVDMGSGESEARSVSFIGLLNYTLLDRYIVQLSFTGEGNSAMGERHRMGYFPTVGISYNMQEEPFLRNMQWIEEIKPRFSLGQSGRAPSGSSIYLGAFESYNPYMTMRAIHPVRMQLNDLRWETSTEYNLGLDLAFLKNKLHFTFDYYDKHTKDLLNADVNVPNSTGYAQVEYINSGEMTNKGWEFRTDLVAYEDRDWRITTYVNFSHNINEVTKIPSNMRDTTYTFGNGNYATIVTEGRPVGSFYGLQYEGVYQNKDATYARDASGNIMNDVNGQPIVMRIGTGSKVKTLYPGDAKYVDQNHDGVINDYDAVYLGSCIPVMIGGAGFAVKYKQLTLNTFFHGRFGMKVINAVRMQNEAMHNGDNQSTAVLRRWRNEGDDTDIPRALFDEGYNYVGSDRFVEDASYVRLKSISLTYALPRKTCKKIGFNAMNFFITGYDLFTFTKYTGQDPEISQPTKANALAQDKANTPVSMRFSCGVNLNF